MIFHSWAPIKPDANLEFVKNKLTNMGYTVRHISEPNAAPWAPEEIRRIVGLSCFIQDGETEEDDEIAFKKEEEKVRDLGKEEPFIAHPENRAAHSHMEFMGEDPKKKFKICYKYHRKWLNKNKYSLQEARAVAQKARPAYCHDTSEDDLFIVRADSKNFGGKIQEWVEGHHRDEKY